MTSYGHELRRQAEEILAAHPALPRRWDAGGALVFPPTSAQGFEVRIEPGADCVTVLAGTGFHDRVEGPAPEAVRNALALVRDLLSSDMRIRERRAGGWPYRWILERRAADGWCAEASTTLLMWNWFGRRAERLYQNDQLPGRLHAADLRGGTIDRPGGPRAISRRSHYLNQFLIGAGFIYAIWLMATYEEASLKAVTYLALLLVCATLSSTRALFFAGISGLVAVFGLRGLVRRGLAGGVDGFLVLVIAVSVAVFAVSVYFGGMDDSHFPEVGSGNEAAALLAGLIFAGMTTWLIHYLTR